MVEPYRSFAKAYIRYWQGLRPVKSQGPRIAALRVIEHVLRQFSGKDSADPTAVTAEILDQAVALAKRHYEPATAYRVGVNIELIAQFLDGHHLTPAAIAWKNPIKRPEEGVRVGEKFERRRKEKMPPTAALDALAISFNIATEPRDVIQASIGALLMAVPARIAELLTLPEDCEVNAPPGSDANLYGLRWWPAKGGDPQIKWVIPSMVDVVKRAIGNIRRVTTHARIVADWYERNPGKLYLPCELEHLRNSDSITISDLRRILGGGNAAAWRAANFIPIKKGKMHFADIELKILSWLPPDFPVFDRRSGTVYSMALFVVLKHQFRDTVTFNCMIDRVGHGHVGTGFGGGLNGGKSSLFERMGFRNVDGTPIWVTTHQFRHMLNTMAQKGGASQLDIAKWSGRKDIKQNADYDHESAGELLARVRAMVGEENGIFGLPAEVAINSPQTREEYSRLVVPTAHTTEIGFCLHDYAMAPCELHRDCLRCAEHVCVKGSGHKAGVVRLQLAEARALLEKAIQHKALEDWGADRWFQAHTDTVSRLEALLEILEDAGTPDGSVIRVGGPAGPSKLVAAAAELGIELSPPSDRSDLAVATRQTMLRGMGEDRE